MVPSLTDAPSTRCNYKEMVYSQKHTKYTFCLRIKYYKDKKKGVLLYLAMTG